MPDENMISSMADTQLMLTIAQASATFVAIMAGFFTTKVISISSDRKRIENKITEDNIIRQGKEVKIRGYKEIISNEAYSLEQLKQKFARMSMKLE